MRSQVSFADLNAQRKQKSGQTTDNEAAMNRVAYHKYTNEGRDPASMGSMFQNEEYLNWASKNGKSGGPDFTASYANVKGADYANMASGGAGDGRRFHTPDRTMSNNYMQERENVTDMGYRQSHIAEGLGASRPAQRSYNHQA